MKEVYGVRWIEVDFGERSEGWHLYTNKQECVTSTRTAINTGNYDDGDTTGYFGPEKPGTVFSIPLDCIDDDDRSYLQLNDQTRTHHRWEPKYKSTGESLESVERELTKEAKANALKDVHTEHCCNIHGCKYGDKDCTVENKSKESSFTCEDVCIGLLND